MPDAADVDAITDAIVTNAQAGVQSASMDGNSATAMSISDQLKAQAAVSQQSVTDVKQLFGNRTRLIPAARQ